MESNLIHAFANETRCDLDTAFTYLQANNWDMKSALESWKHLHGSDEEENTQTDEDKKQIFERSEGKKLSRGISRATDNINLVNRARCEFASKITPNYLPQENWYFMETPSFSFTLPDLSAYGEDFRKFLERDLIENSVLVSLEQSGRLNWWTDSGGQCQKLWPLATTGDGNCLLHAASLAIWGFHDRLLTLRKALHSFLESSQYIAALYRRWRWQQTKVNEQSGFVYSETEWLKEWQNIIHMASVEPRKNNIGLVNDRYGGGSPNVYVDTKYTASTYESLEEIHVLVLAHVLRRPIVVVADVMLRDMNNEPFAPIPFGGIYLPFEFPAQNCHRSPLLLTYDMAHFSALVAMDTTEKLDKAEKSEKTNPVIPLVDSDGMLLPVQFCVDPGLNFNWYEKHDQSVLNSLIPTEKDQIALLKKYLDVVDLSEESTTSPDIDSEDEIEKRFIEVSDLPEIEITLFGSKNRAAKQLQSVARQFGSIGKSMSKKLKKNFVSITKPNKPKKSEGYRNRLLCAEIQIKRHPYQDEMIKNYLLYAKKRFLREQKQKTNLGRTPEYLRLQELALLEGPLKCINSNCDSYGTVLTSYMCTKCYETQRNEELLSINIDSRFGTGRSKFYRDSDAESYNAVKNIPISKSNMNSDRTLYLSKSTFYYDNDTPESLKENRKIITEPLKVTVYCTDKENNNTQIVRHVSKFDFGNVNDEKIINKEPTMKDYVIEAELNDLQDECNRKPATFIGSELLNSNEDIQILLNNKKDELNAFSLEQPTMESRSNLNVQPCKSNNCTNVASAHTDFYCSNCNKNRKTSDVTI